MEKKYKIEDTKLMCKFMGYNIWKPWIAKFKLFDHDMVSTPDGTFELNTLHYEFTHNWVWVKRMINKIGSIEYSKKDGMREYIAINWSDSKLNIYSSFEETYDCVNDFIKWYYD